MERIQKKCLIASVATHGLLLALLVVGAAFIKPPQPREIIPIKYFSGKLVDSVLNGGGGGAPQVIRSAQPPTPAPPAPAPPTPHTQVDPPAPPPPPATSSKKKAEVEPPVSVRDNGLLKANKSKTITDTADSSSKSKINTKLTTRSKTSDKNSKSKPSDSGNPSSKTNARLTAFNKAVGELGKGLTSGGLAMSDFPGTGAGGGPGAANYSQAVLGAYDDAWNPPAELAEDAAVAFVRITVHRTGRIVDARIVTRSNNALMDRSVLNALEAVKSLPPFPEGAKDLERVFKIEFNLKVKRGIG
jgi:TonB family protein